MKKANVYESIQRQLNPKLFWEDFEVGQVRETHAAGQGFTFEAQDIIDFASRFDPQYFHLDAEAAKGSLFGGLCASGWHTASVTMRLICDGWNLDCASLGSPGLADLKWLKPVLEGDTIRVRLEVLETRPMNSRPGVGLIQSIWSVLNQRDEAVMQMTGWSMLRKRPVQPL